ncbi:hypothetical protein U1Q18_004681, partial [Sarracenia purpurea var. burkii]
ANSNNNQPKFSLRIAWESAIESEGNCWKDCRCLEELSLASALTDRLSVLTELL